MLDVIAVLYDLLFRFRSFFSSSHPAGMLQMTPSHCTSPQILYFQKYICCTENLKGYIQQCSYFCINMLKEYLITKFFVISIRFTGLPEASTGVVMLRLLRAFIEKELQVCAGSQSEPHLWDAVFASPG